MKSKKRPVLGSDAGDSLDNQRLTHWVTIPKGSAPENDAQAKLLNFLLHRTSFTKERREFGHWINVHHTVLKSLGGSDYAKKIKRLQRSKNIEVNPSYKVGAFSMSYRLATKFREPFFEHYKLKRGTRMARHRIRFESDDCTGLRLARRFRQIHLSEDCQGRGWGHLVADSIRSGDYYATRCGYGRFHSTFTAAPRTLRKHLTNDDREPLIEVDVSNCQPLLLGLLIAREETNTPHHQQSKCRTLNEYFELCSDGNLYEFLTAKALETDTTLFQLIPEEHLHWHAKNRLVGRKDIKTAFLAAIFAKTELMSRMKIWQIISNHWPAISRFVVRMKKNDHRSLARSLQEFESEIMVGQNSVATTLLDHTNHGFFTIHDGIAVPEHLAEFTQELVVKKFESYGARPMVSCK